MPSTGCKDANQRGGPPRPENCHSVQYRPTKCSEIFAQRGIPSLMKLDVEGSEWPCVHALQRLRSSCRPRYLIIEASSQFDLDLLLRLGYDSFKWVRQINHMDVWGASSGPFGEFGWDCQTGYRWRSASNTTALFSTLYPHKRMQGTGTSPPQSDEEAHETRRLCGGWADLHARHRTYASTAW